MRYLGIAGNTGRWRNNLIAKIVASKSTYDDETISPVVRQTLQHWGYQLTNEDYESYAKKVKQGARTSFIPGGTVVDISEDDTKVTGKKRGVGSRKG